MPFFEYRLTVPKATLAADPVSSTIGLSPGRLIAVEIVFPRGCVQLVHTIVTRSNHQVYPANLDADIAGEGGAVAWSEDTILDDDPYLLDLVAWSDDDRFDHTLTYRFNLLPMESVRRDLLLSDLECTARERALGLQPDQVPAP